MSSSVGVPNRLDVVVAQSGLRELRDSTTSDRTSVARSMSSGETLSRFCVRSLAQEGPGTPRPDFGAMIAGALVFGRRYSPSLSPGDDE